MRERFVAMLDERSPLKEQVVLELGCGDGIFTKQLAERAFHVVAVDGRGLQVERAKTFCSFQQNTTFEVADVESGWLDARRADPKAKPGVVFHVGLLYHLLDPALHLRRICDWQPVHTLFLDTHFATDKDCNAVYQSNGMLSVRCAEKSEQPHESRAGMNKLSRWLPSSTILDILEGSFRNVEVLDRRIERNGPRITVIAKRN